MITVEYTRRFLRDFARLPPELQEEVLEKVKLFKNPRNHQRLRVHKLHGDLMGKMSFSISYRLRIIFEYIGKQRKIAALITVGDHSIYD